MSLASEPAFVALRAELLSFVRRHVRDEHAAEDLLQEVFARVHDSIGSLRDEELLAQWVYRIARNCIADHRRRAALEPLADVDEPAAPASEEGNLNAEIDRWLRAMLGALPQEYREAVELADLQGLPQREVAERLGLSLSGAKSRVQRGRQQLRGLLGACCHLDFDRRGNVLDYERHGTCAGCEGAE